MKKLLLIPFILLAFSSSAFASTPSGFTIDATTYASTETTGTVTMMCYSYGCGYNSPNSNLVIFNMTTGAVVSHVSCGSFNGNYPSYHDCSFTLPSAGSYKVAYMGDWSTFSGYTTYTTFHNAYLVGSAQNTDPWWESAFTVTTPPPPPQGIGTLIGNATSSFTALVGFSPSDSISWQINNLLKPLIGGGLSLLYVLRYVIIAVLVIFGIIQAGKMAFRFFKS